MTSAKQHDRVVHASKSPIAGTVLQDSDPVSKLARVLWDSGRTSLIFVGALNLYKSDGLSKDNPIEVI